jgi:hypothetical protein
MSQNEFSLNDRRRIKLRRVKNGPKKPLKMKLSASTHGDVIRWASKHQVVWLSQILCD